MSAIADTAAWASIVGVKLWCLTGPDLSTDMAIGTLRLIRTTMGGHYVLSLCSPQGYDVINWFCEEIGDPENFTADVRVA